MRNEANFDERATKQVIASARVLGYQLFIAAHLPATESGVLAKVSKQATS